MVANMAFSGIKQADQRSPSSKGTAQDPHQFAWIFKADMPDYGKADSRSSCGLIPSPDDSSNSWETRAFAEDASSLAAGIWPPRAYPCSFCRREFRSAQALGGHMNVHRRDRARLRHSSPPSSPFGGGLTFPQPSALFQDQKYSADPSVPNPNESFRELDALSIASIMPTYKPVMSLDSTHTSDIATSFPLRLQQLASEAASSLMYPQARDSSDPLSLVWPASTSSSSRFACRSKISATPCMKPKAMEISSLSSFPSPPSSILSCAGTSATEETLCRREAPIIRPEDESPKKKSHTDSNHRPQFSESSKSEKSSHHDALHAQGTLFSLNKAGAEGTSSDWTQRKEACSGIDLELRLGRKPP